MLLQILTGILLGLHYTSEISNNTDAKGSKRVKIRCQGSIIYTSSNQAIAISKSNNPLNMCLFIILFNYWIAILIGNETRHKTYYRVFNYLCVSVLCFSRHQGFQGLIIC